MRRINYLVLSFRNWLHINRFYHILPNKLSDDFNGREAICKILQIRLLCENAFNIANNNNNK